MSNPDELVGKEINGYKIVRLIGNIHQISQIYG